MTTGLRKRHIVLALLAALAIITFLDRLAIAVAGPRIQADLNIPTHLWGWVLGSFVLAYGIFEIPTGAMGDRIGQRKVLARIVLWWSAFTALTGAAHSFWFLVLVRFLFGAGEAGAFPNASGVIARWFPVHERARAQGAVFAASRLGGALTPLLVVPLQAAIGWRATFLVLGLIGVVWAAVWLAWYRDDCRQQPGISPEEIAEIGPQASVGRHRDAPWGVLLGSPQLWLIAAMYFCYAAGPWFYFSWFPTFLMRGAGFSEREMGWFATLPFLLGAAGSLVGGVVGDRLVRRWGLRAGRKRLAVGSLLVSSLLVVALALSRDKTLVVALSTLGFGIMDLMLASAWAVCLDVGAAHAGVVTGVMNTAGQGGGFVCTVLFGYVVRATGSYRAPLALVAAMLACSAALFARIDPARPLVPTTVSALKEAR
ncbi:MAG: MFS transporter [Bryobacterales bacterium]|nr:MFS transporter [Bryobacteraceae bacterium]MDW8129459.1 MFS transporter [Bryobacterales bacterium]